MVLKKGQETLDERVFEAQENISQKLLPHFDELLKKNDLSLKDVEKVDVETDLGETYTSRRIAEAMKNAFDWTRQKETQSC